MREITNLPPPKSVGIPALSACHSIAPPAATAIEGFLHGKGINWVSIERYETLVPSDTRT